MEDDAGHDAETLKLAERMKQYEAKVETRIDSARPFLLRLDGHKFSTFTRGFTKPFDRRLHTAMVLAAADVANHLHARTAYTQSDEITLVFVPPTPEEGKEQQTMIFGGRVQKLASLASSLCSVRFNHHLMQQDFSDNDALRQKVHSGAAFFDGRVIPIDTEAEAVNNLIWRSIHDCARNAKLNFGLHHFSQKELHGLKTHQVVQKLKEEKGIDYFTATPLCYQYGTYIKKDLYDKEGVNPKTGEVVPVKRGKVVAKAFAISFSEETIRLITAKYWSDVPTIAAEFVLEAAL